MDDILRRVRENDPTLTFVALSHQSITDEDMLAFKGNTHVSYLNASGNKLTNIDFMIGNATITKLYVIDNNIKSLEPLRGNTTLDTLDIERNLVDDLSPLETLSQLIRLDVRCNRVSDVSPLAHVHIKTLILDANPITDISPLKNSNIWNIFIRDVHLTDISPLWYNTNVLRVDAHETHSDDHTSIMHKVTTFNIRNYRNRNTTLFELICQIVELRGLVCQSSNCMN